MFFVSDKAQFRANDRSLQGGFLERGSYVVGLRSGWLQELFLEVENFVCSERSRLLLEDSLPSLFMALLLSMLSMPSLCFPFVQLRSYEFLEFLQVEMNLLQRLLLFSARLKLADFLLKYPHERAALNHLFFEEVGPRENHLGKFFPSDQRKLAERREEVVLAGALDLLEVFEFDLYFFEVTVTLVKDLHELLHA